MRDGGYTSPVLITPEQTINARCHPTRGDSPAIFTRRTAAHGNLRNLAIGVRMTV